MTPIVETVQRYRRTDQDRLGQWAPVGASWKTPASSGLVSHDVYHHLPSDTGNFAQEVAALGAEWYIDIQSMDGEFSGVSKEKLKSFERNVRDSVDNALDSRESNAFALPAQPDTARLTVPEMHLFFGLAEAAHQRIIASGDARAAVMEAFEARFVSTLLWGYGEAKKRFPDQRKVRDASRALAYDLEYLPLDEVPYGHEIAIALKGYACEITYEDADASFLAEESPLTGFAMLWCHDSPGFPLQDMTVHPCRASYLEFAEERLAEEAGHAQVIPTSEVDCLRKVYVKTTALKEVLASGGHLKLPADQYRTAPITPRGVLVL